MKAMIIANLKATFSFLFSPTKFYSPAKYSKNINSKYRTHANKGRSWIIAAHLILPRNAKTLLPLDIWQRSQFMAWLPFRSGCSDASSQGIYFLGMLLTILYQLLSHHPWLGKTIHIFGPHIYYCHTTPKLYYNLTWTLMLVGVK